MSENVERCPLCGGERQPGTTTFAVDLTFGFVVVRKVPVFVCAQCGDAWVDGPVAPKLESIVAEARRKQTLMEVTQWEQVA
jgi:YgiT-type zinc finger domain-containing protein